MSPKPHRPEQRMLRYHTAAGRVKEAFSIRGSAAVIRPAGTARWKPLQKLTDAVDMTGQLWVPDQTREHDIMASRTITWSIQPDYTTIATAKLIEVSTGGDAAAWLEFIKRFHGIIAITAFRAARRWGEADPQTIDGLIQETYLKLCADRGRMLRKYRFEHQDVISGFLKLITVNVADDYFRALYNDKHGWNTAGSPRDCSETRRDTDRPAELTDPERALLVDRADLCLRDMTPAETRDRDPI
jgi:hypothetical protein